MTGKLEARHPSDLALHHRNPRVGDVPAIAASLRANGQYKPIVVNRGSHTGRPLEVLAGNHTLLAIRDLAEEYPSDERWQSVDCWVIDVDDDRATRIVAADNRTSELGTFDDRLLAELLADLDDLEGTGYDPYDLDNLADRLAGGDYEGDLGGDSDDEDPEDDTDDEPGGRVHAEDTGALLSIADVSIGEPVAQPKHGETYRLGRHILVMAKLLDEHHLWAHHLEDGVRFVPYPEPYITTTNLAQENDLLLVQPNKYLAGHLIDKHNSTWPDQQAVLQ